MPVHSTVLTDVAAGVSVAQHQWGPKDEIALSGSKDWSLTKRTLRGGPSEGVDVVELNNGALSVSVLPTRGMGLWKGSYRGIELGWKSPVALPVHPALVNQSDRNGLGWLAGFNEWLCRCGLASFGPPGIDKIKDAKGSVVAEWPLTLHGKIANIPAHKVTVEVDTTGPGTLRVSGEVDETTLFGPCLRLKSTTETQAGSNKLVILDEITNLAGTPGEMMILYHINLGRPLLEAGARVLHAARELAPRDAHAATGIGHWETYLPPTPGYREQCYFVNPAADDQGRTLALLRNAAGTAGLAVRYNRKQLPWFTLWKNTQAEADGYVTGVEPGTGFPNLRSFEREQGRVVKLGPGESHQVRLELEVHHNRDGVAAVEDEIASLQRRESPQIRSEPNPAWSA